MNWLTSRGFCLLAGAALWLALPGCDTGTALNVDLPDTAGVNTQYQDLPVDVATIRLSPVQTLKADHYLIGRLDDNVAGTTEARAYFNLVSGGVTDSLPSKFTAPVLDSVVVAMGFDNVYGTSSSPVRFDVYQLQAALDDRQVYDASSVQPLGPALGQNLTSRLNRTQVQVLTAAVPATTTTAAVPAVTAVVPDPSVRLLLQRRAVPATPTRPAQPAVPLPFADNLFAQLRQPNFGQAQLDAALKGLAITPSAGYSGSIVSFGRTYSTRMLFYFHADTLRRSYSVYFGPVYSSSGLAASNDPRYYTQITNALPPALSALSQPAGAVPPPVLNGTSYAQEGVGLATRITFKGLDELTKAANAGSLTINRAELRAPVKPYSNALFPNPAQLYAVEVGPSNNILTRTVNYLPTDRIVQADGSSQLAAGNPAVATLTAGGTTQAYYTLPITSYLQAYLTDKLDGNPTSLVLAPNIRNSTSLSLNRAALDANNITLRVYYSKR